jgi:hypothetical protein
LVTPIISVLISLLLMRSAKHPSIAADWLPLSNLGAS